MPQDIITIEYRFQLRDQPEKILVIRLRKPRLDLLAHHEGPLPAWTRLDHCQCPNCPLQAATRPNCPIAVNLVGLIDAFRDCLSTETADITISTESREIRKRAPVQYGVSSLMGLIMATSGCPIMDKLRPMTHTHLPFSTIEETMYRTVSMYLFAQYYLRQRGRPADWDLAGLIDHFEAIGRVNQAFSRRLVSINPKDASLNALANLDCFALATAFSIERDRLKEFEELFHAYYD